MPISQQIGSSSLAKPGVCTSATRPAYPHDGQVIYETDTDSTLVWNGSAWVYLSTSTANPVGLELIKTQTIGSAVTSVTVSNVFSSTYDAYKIAITGGNGSTSQALNLTIGAANANYYMQRNYVDWATSTYGDVSVNNGAAFLTCGAFSTTSISFNCEVLNPFLTTRTIISGQFVLAVAGGEGQSFSGFLNDAVSYSSFTIAAAAGTLTGGTIRVYGYKN